MNREATGRTPASAAPGLVRVSTPLVRRKRSQVVLEAPSELSETGPPSKVAQMLGLGHEIVRLVEEGVLEDLTDAAEVLGFSRGRISQIVDLTLLAPDLQEALLLGVTNTATAERRLRTVVAAGDWGEQRRRWREGASASSVR